MDMAEFITEHLPTDHFVPAVGQGSVAIQSAKHLDPILSELIRQACNHAPTEACLLAERSLLAKLDGGCSVPVYGFAYCKEDQIQLQAGVLSLDGQEKMEKIGFGSNGIAVGNEVAEHLIMAGAQELLKKYVKHYRINSIHMKQQVLITGSNGLLGQKLVQLLSQESEIELIATARGANRLPVSSEYLYVSFDITQEAEVNQVFETYKPNMVIHTAAMTNVDMCETDPEGCELLNVTAVTYLIRACENTILFLSPIHGLYF